MVDGHAHPEVRQSGAWLALALRIGRMMAWEVDFRTQGVQLAGDLAELLGLPDDHRIDTLDAALALVFPDDLDTVLATLQRAAAAQPAVDVQFRIQHTDGTARWFEGRAESVLDAAGRVIGARGVLVDIEHRKQTEGRLLVADRMASVGLLGAGVAHEINNPLTALLANLTLAERQVRASAAAGAGHRPGRELHELIRDAVAAADQVRKIVRDLATLSQDGGGGVAGPVDVRAVLESSIRMAANEIRHRARLVRDLAEVPAVFGDESRLGQVFLNLLINAAQAISEGHADQHEVRVATRRHDDQVIVEVSDTGCGMTPEIQRRLFTPFFTTKPPGTGTGLGLPICQRLVTELGGRIEVKSVAGAGTTFTVRLPISAAPAPPPQPGAAPTDRRCRVLVVEDEPAVGIAVRRLLIASHEVEVAAGGRAALRRLGEDARFDVILCDLMMPDMSGMELHDALERSHPALARRMIFVSGGAFTIGARSFLARFPERRLDKPFDLPRLLALIAAIASPAPAP